MALFGSPSARHPPGRGAARLRLELEARWLEANGYAEVRRVRLTEALPVRNVAARFALEMAASTLTGSSDASSTLGSARPMLEATFALREPPPAER